MVIFGPFGDGADGKNGDFRKVHMDRDPRYDTLHQTDSGSELPVQHIEDEKLVDKCFTEKDKEGSLV